MGTATNGKRPLIIHHNHATISRIELFIYAVFYLSIVGYGLHNLYDNATKIIQGAPNYLWKNPSVAGRFIQNHFQDIADYEWTAFEGHWLRFLLCGLLNAGLTWLLAKMSLHRLRSYSAAIAGLVTMIITCGVQNTAIFAAEHLAVYAVMRISRMPLVFGWLIAAVHLFAPMPNFTSDGPFFAGNSFAALFSMWAWAWNDMRYVSFGSEWQWQLKRQARKCLLPTAEKEASELQKDQELAKPEKQESDGNEVRQRLQTSPETENVEQKKEPSEDESDLKKEPDFTFGFLDFIGFLWYTPSIFGSIITYRHYYEQVLGPFVARKAFPTRKFQIRPFLRQFAVVAFWLLFTLIWGELFMLYTMEQEPSDLYSLNGFGTGVMTWTHGQYFQAKYMVIYGLPWLLAFLDQGVELTPLPICISRVYLYSNMWKYFDTGLYDFLKSYIYIPVSRSFGGKKLIAGSATFLFIWAWHGANVTIGLWTVCNFIEIAIEALLRHAANDPKSFIYRQIRSRISGVKWRRLEALACSVSFTFSGFANAYFLMGYPAAKVITWRTFLPSTVNFWVYIITSYAWVQTVFTYENWQSGAKL